MPNPEDYVLVVEDDRVMLMRRGTASAFDVIDTESTWDEIVGFILDLAQRGDIEIEED